MQAKCLECDQMGHHARDCTSPSRYLAISPSDFFIASYILSMWIVYSRIQTKEVGTMKLYRASNRLLHGLIRTHVEITIRWLLEELEHAS